MKIVPGEGITNAETPFLRSAGYIDNKDNTRVDYIELKDNSNQWSGILNYKNASGFADGQWHKIMYTLTSNNNKEPFLRFEVAMDGTKPCKYIIAEPRVAVVKYQALKRPPAETEVNNVRITVCGDYSTKFDFIGVRAGDEFFPVENGKITLPGDVDMNSLRAVSTYGDMPFRLEKQGDTYNITAYSTAYNSADTTITQRNNLNRLANKYTYSDGSTTTVFDYEKHLQSPVKEVGTPGGDKNIQTPGGSPVPIESVNMDKIHIDFKKNDTSVKSEGDIAAETASDYTLSVSCNHFENCSLILAYYAGDRLASVNKAAFEGGSASATLAGIKPDENASFKAFVWDMGSNMLTPITNSITVGDDEVGYIFPTDISRVK